MARWVRTSRIEPGLRCSGWGAKTLPYLSFRIVMTKPRADLVPNTADYENLPLVTANGFREYDARWLFGKEINLLGIQALGLGLGTYLHDIGVQPKVVTGHDYRSYSQSIKQSLILGLLQAGCEVHDIGLALSPVAYFAQFHLDCPAVAMVTASHNENGWTGVKMGAARPLTFGPDEINAIKDIVLNGKGKERDGGKYIAVADMRETYLQAVTKGHKLSRPIKVIAACGNGTAGAFAPEALRRIGAEVIGMDTELDFTFPKYNPNPEDMEMLHAMGHAVKEQSADLCLGFDGDGDRCGVVDDKGREIFADKIGVMLARGRCEIHRALPDRSGAEGQWRQDRLLEDRAFLHQAPHFGIEGAGGLRKVRSLLLQSADRLWL